MTTVILTGGRVIDPSQQLDEIADVVIVAGKIDAIGRGLADAPRTTHAHEPRRTHDR